MGHTWHWTRTSFFSTTSKRVPIHHASVPLLGTTLYVLCVNIRQNLPILCSDFALLRQQELRLPPLSPNPGALTLGWAAGKLKLRLRRWYRFLQEDVASC